MSDVAPIARALCVAIVGAESTGKSALAVALALALAREFGLRCVRVDEVLREWCDAHARTPRADEQLGIATEHARRIAEAAARPDVDLVLCDTTPLMVAVYSALLFDDRSLQPLAAACQRRMDATLLTSLDLPWVADGLQRDGPHVRGPVDALVRDALLASGVDWTVISGFGDARTAHALDALRPLLSTWIRCGHSPSGLFTALQSAEVGPRRLAARACARCDDGAPAA